ncbi:WD40-repeat-containing domain protein [Crucibulum laeve]|uniref:DNA damage-binding protein CMR1 n=1 Tax=Crucibulum laeve TaxID=68775 RepID=A0A5C3MC97_9AGAR|nr:WD40-repeat-containing domain protein [Crucibulum laeve]
MAKISQYELEREANIARNRALLEQLELKQAVSDLPIPKSKTAKSKAKPVQPVNRNKREREPEAPRRQSARLRKDTVDPNETPAQKRKREREAAERRAQEEEERLQVEEQARIAKRPRHQDLKLVTLVETNGPEEMSTLSTALGAAAQKSQPRRVGDPDAFVFEEKKDAAAAVAELREKLQDMKVVSRAKVTQERIYSAAYHPEITKDLVFFGDKHGALGIWDAQAPQEEQEDEDGDVSVPPENREGGKYWRLQLHWPATAKSSISSVKFDPIDSHNVYTSSYDCTIRSLSFTSGVSREIYASNDRVLICSIDLAPTGNEMWISDGEGGATHLDLREAKSKARRYVLSEQKIGCISINPTRPNFILTASNSRFLKIWDTRKLQSMSAALTDDAPLTPPTSLPGESGTSEDVPPRGTVEFDAEVVTEFLASNKGKSCLRGEFKHDKSASSAYWDPRGRQIVSTSYDDTIRLWDLDSPLFKSSGTFPSFKPFSRIRHNCQTGKWLTILRAQWSPNPDVYPHFTIGNMNHALDLYSSNGDLVARLSDPARITAVQAVTASHPSILERAVSGNASGRCVLWAPSDS